jgi:molybdopterin-guanine dinucleotide biosynthesis protein A
MIPAHATGIVLAGGQSSRMGENKALLDYKGQPLVMHAAVILKQVCHHVIISAGNHAYSFPGYETWADDIQIAAPLAGIYTCLKRSPDRVNVVLSCDMPRVDPAFILQMLTFAGEYEMVVPEHTGYVEPLCAVYCQDLLPLIEKQISKKDYALKHLLNLGNTKIMEVDTMGFSSSMFLNVNTYEDYNLLNPL